MNIPVNALHVGWAAVPGNIVLPGQAETSRVTNLALARLNKGEFYYSQNTVGGTATHFRHGILYSVPSGAGWDYYWANK